METGTLMEREREGNENGNGNGNGNVNGRFDRDRQRQTDVSNKETDSVRWTCRTERRTASYGRVGQKRAALDERRRYRDTET